jgi:hypothetical protein
MKPLAAIALALSCAVLFGVLMLIHWAMHRIQFVCWFSARFWDIHDYFVHAGGDGTPSHFYDYHCWNCGKKFNI